MMHLSVYHFVRVKIFYYREIHLSRRKWKRPSM